MSALVDSHGDARLATVGLHAVGAHRPAPYRPNASGLAGSGFRIQDLGAG